MWFLSLFVVLFLLAPLSVGSLLFLAPFFFLISVLLTSLAVGLFANSLPIFLLAGGVYFFARRYFEVDLNPTGEKQVQDRNNQVECPSCGSEVNKSEVICPNCYADLQVNCEHCGEVVSVNDTTCPHCGASLGIRKNTP